MTTPTLVWAEITHPRIEERAADIESLLKDELGYYCVAAAIAPNFTVTRARADPILRRAFSAGPHMSVLSRANPRADFAESAPIDNPELISGFAVKVDGQRPLDSIPLLYRILGAWNQGLRTSMYKVTAMPEGFDRATNADFDKLKERVLNELSGEMPPTHRITIERSCKTLAPDEYAIFVRANDVDAANEFWHRVVKAAVSEKPMTLEEAVYSPDFEQIHVRAQQMCDAYAYLYAHALGITIDQEPVVTSVHYTIKAAIPLAHGIHASPVAYPAAQEPRFFIVYNNTSPTHEAIGGVLMSHGIMGGHTLIYAEDKMAWQVPSFLSLMPATAPEAYEGHTDIKASARLDNEALADAFANRVAWQSDLPHVTEHPMANESFYSIEDPYMRHTLDVLGPPHLGALRVQQFAFVAGVLPSLSTLYMPSEQLYELALSPDTEVENITVAMGTEIPNAIVPNWDKIVENGFSNDMLGEVFLNVQRRRDIDVNVMYALARPRACPASEDDSSITNIRQVAVTDKNSLPEIRQFDTVHSEGNNLVLDSYTAHTPSFQSLHVLALPKALIIIVCKDVLGLSPITPEN